MRPAVRTPPWLFPTRASGLVASVLDPDTLDRSRRLLYEVYTEGVGWDPPTPNASGLHADHARRLLVDDFDHRAVWLGVSDGPELVATMRLLSDRDGPLELEGYLSIPASLPRPLVEANRVAVRRPHRRTLALPLLHTLAASVARRIGARHSIATTSARLAVEQGARYGWVWTGQQFRYHPSDPEEVHVVTYDLRRRHELAVLSRVVMSSLGISRRSRRSR